LEWLHEGGESCFGRFFSLIFFVKFLLRSGSNLLFFALAPRSGFGAAISVAAALSFFCFATQSLQIAVQAYWSGCADDFPFNFLLESASICFSGLASRPGFEAAISAAM